MYLNQATIIGNIIRKPELKALPSGSHVVNFSVATNRTWKDKDGQKQEDVEFHNVVAFGKQAEVIAQYMDKGSQILVEGRLQTRNWEQDGVKRYATEIIVENFQFGKKAETTQEELLKKENKTSDEIEYPEEEINPEDIPF